MSKKYRVLVKETAYYQVTVEADSKQDARYDALVVHQNGNSAEVDSSAASVVSVEALPDELECDGCDQDPWRTPVHYGTCPLAECGRQLVLGGREDPYETSCVLTQGSHEVHEGPDPFGGPGFRVRWRGGGTCAGDPLPHSDLEFIEEGGGS